MQRSVLLLDLDPQGNTTMGSGVDKTTLAASMTEVLLGEQALKSVLINTEAGYDVGPSNSELTAAEIGLLSLSRREQRLLQALVPERSRYDFVIIDCPPALNMLTLNALAAADSILIPMQCEYYALEGVSGLMETIKQIKDSVNPRLSVEGVLRTMYDGRSRLTLEVSDQLAVHFGPLLYNTVIPRNVRLAEAPSHGLPALMYDRMSPGAQAYLALAKEILQAREADFSDQGQAVGQAVEMNT